MLTPGDQEVEDLGDGLDAARVTPAIVTVPANILAWAKAKLPKQVQLEQGPYASTLIHVEPGENPHTLALFGLTGSVEQHSDGAGKTLGLVLSVSGSQRLQIGEITWPLEAGCVYHIDSDIDHGTIADGDDDEMVFVCFDFMRTDRLPQGFTYRDAAELMLAKIDDMMTGKDF